MYQPFATNKFKKDLKRCNRQNKDMNKLKKIIDLLCHDKKLPIRNKDHFLSGNWANYRECHVEPDWLLIYQINTEDLLVELIRLGSHAELF